MLFALVYGLESCFRFCGGLACPDPLLLRSMKTTSTHALALFSGTSPHSVRIGMPRVVWPLTDSRLTGKY